VAGFGSLSLTKVSEDKVQMAQPVAKLDSMLRLLRGFFLLKKSFDL
jgi:hypothetical protein